MDEYKISEEDLKGDISDFPIEVVRHMIICQKNQKNTPDVRVFQYNRLKGSISGGFDWIKTSDGKDFWERVIKNKEFTLYFQRYPYGVTDCPSCEETKTIKIQIPEGYEIDSEHSTFSEIKFKKKVKVDEFHDWLSKRDRLFSGFIIGLFNEIKFFKLPTIPKNMVFDEHSCKSVFKHVIQAKSALAYSQITQIMGSEEYNGEWCADWEDNSQKYVLVRIGNNIRGFSYQNCYSPIAFKSAEIRDKFWKSFPGLLKEYFEL